MVKLVSLALLIAFLVGGSFSASLVRQKRQQRIVIMLFCNLYIKFPLHLVVAATNNVSGGGYNVLLQGSGSAPAPAPAPQNSGVLAISSVQVSQSGSGSIPAPVVPTGYATGSVSTGKGSAPGSTKDVATGKTGPVITKP